MTFSYFDAPDFRFKVNLLFGKTALSQFPAFMNLTVFRLHHRDLDYILMVLWVSSAYVSQQVPVSSSLQLQLLFAKEKGQNNAAPKKQDKLALKPAAS